AHSGRREVESFVRSAGCGRHGRRRGRRAPTPSRTSCGRPRGRRSDASVGPVRPPCRCIARGLPPPRSVQVVRSFRSPRRPTLASMTFAGLLAFLGLAVVTMDVLGGMLAMGMLLRGGTMRHLLAFAAGYVAVVVAATLVLPPLLTLLGRWLHPVLESNDAIGAVEAVVGLALIGFGVHQFRAASQPPGPHGPLEARAAPARLATLPLILGGVAFAGTALADPAFT